MPFQMQTGLRCVFDVEVRWVRVFGHAQQCKRITACHHNLTAP